jgi:hypothetical protein
MAQAHAAGRPRIRLVLLLAVILLLALAAMLVGRGQGADTRPIGLFTSLPILWREARELRDLLQSDAPPHWARGVIAAHGRLEPLDTLAGKDGKLPLPPRALLVMAQPRALAPAENVALDDWVQSGGRVLLFADPMLTADSAFALGDRRRPQEIVLLSPILRRWGLELQFDETQPFGEHEVPLFGNTVPVNLPGRFASAGSRCTREAGGLAVSCRIGRGEVLAIADAALLEERHPNDTGKREQALAGLLERLAGGI